MKPALITCGVLAPALYLFDKLVDKLRVSSDTSLAIKGGSLALFVSLFPVLILIVGLHSRKRFRAILRERLLQHGVPMCLSCGYCLRGSPADAQRCPECGKPIPDRVRALMNGALQCE